MRRTILDETHARHKAQLSDQLKRLLAFCARLGHNELHELVANQLANLDEPFLFVVVGEVKSGKSSFVNALLSSDVCAVDPAPCTDIIQQIVYAERAEEYRVNPHLKRIGLPQEILKSIAIVDTPGTNTVIEHHQELTKTFIPNSDIVFVVFPAKNPHTKTAWDFLDFVADEWRKSVVFILQQADLARPDELKVNTEKVIEYAGTHGIASPRVFATSAELERQGRDDSGFEAIRAMIRETVTGGKHVRLKLESILRAASRAEAQLDARLQQMASQLERDRAIVETMRTRLT
ncbi:MAG: dynamin family protein, partial [Myxococcales bacterium]|nr:dynamin family protein [Myxococcales bacterium]